jgi:hypothetical protein
VDFDFGPTEALTDEIIRDNVAFTNWIKNQWLESVYKAYEVVTRDSSTRIKNERSLSETNDGEHRGLNNHEVTSGFEQLIGDDGQIENNHRNRRTIGSMTMKKSKFESKSGPIETIAVGNEEGIAMKRQRMKDYIRQKYSWENAATIVIKSITSK